MRIVEMFCLAASIACSARAVAQSQAPAPPQSSSAGSSVTTLQVNTRLTLVDVTVTDSKGHPVRGLTQRDFTVKEDGKDQPIKDFEELGGGKPAEAALPPNVYSNAQPPNAQAVNILLLDQVSTGIGEGLQSHPEALKAAKDKSLSFLKTMPAGTKVAILEMDGSGLHTVQGFTTDRDLLLAAVNSITYQRIAEGIWDPPQSAAVPGLPPEKPNYLLLCNAVNYQSSRALNALNQMALFVSSVPGRKNVMWFTPGIPWLTNYLPFSQSENVACISDFTKELQAVYGRLTAMQVALYPIDPFGVRMRPSFQDSGSLEDMAKATGGKAYFGRNDLDGALRDAAAIGADYYALSYVPPLSKYDGKHHTIEVKVDRPGMQLEYRRGYTSLDLDGPVLQTTRNRGKAAPPKDPFHAAMDYGAPAATQVVFAVRALPSTEPRKPGVAAVIGSLNPELKGKPLARYQFDFDLPRNKITLVEQPDGSRKGSFELMIAAYDVQGRRLNSLEEKRTIALKADGTAGFLQKPFVVPVEIDLPPGAISVRAGVLDIPSEEMGVVEIPLSVAK